MTCRSLLLVALLVGGCSMNPKLEKPTAPVAAAYPGTDEADATGALTPAWREMFGDPRLQKLIELALRESRDLRIAALNVEAARAQFRIQRGALLPAVEAQGSYTRQRIPASVAGAGLGLEGGDGPSGFEFGQYGAQAALTTFEIDLFGRLRSLSQAASERYLATDEGRRATQIALVGAVADAYLAERHAEEQLRLTESTLADWRASLDLVRRLHAAAQSSGLELSQAEGLVHQAEADLQARTRALAEARNALELLIGAPTPADLPTPIGLMEQPIRMHLAVGAPSDLLLRRPDIRQAEHELVAVNADVGAARAAFFPRLSLTAAFGVTSLMFDNLFSNDNRTWSFTPQITAPIFQGGRLRGSLDLAKVRKSSAVARYEQSIQAAFREVADGLAGRATFDGQLAAQRSAADSATRRVYLSNLRYRAGVDSRLELLDAQRAEYAARLAMLETRRQGLSSAIGLYRALGGGLD